MPITFINKVVGSTATIVSELYHLRSRRPPPAIAGLMLAAILSDTVMLQSPTTTPLDREMAGWLAKEAGVDIGGFGEQMFSAGCALDATDPHQLVHQDLKIFQEGGWKFSVSQMETVGFNKFHDIRDALTQELQRARDQDDCHLSCLMVTDITKSTSLLLCAGEEKLVGAISYPRLGENLFEMTSVLSRKKQMVPYLLDLIRRL
jgi:manganese-dependent inorganic pyrophosphatase